jgi:flagellar basal-body rod protein FlgC
MTIFNSLRTSATGLSAERLRMDLIANNLANAETTRTDEGGPYVRQMAVFKPYRSFESILNDKMSGGSLQGVAVDKIVKDKAPFRLEYEPEHPDAIQEEGELKGYVRYPNVNPVKEMIDMISASRAYEANVTVMNSAKSMAMKALEIGRG